ncbi:unnamed protein product, partial [Musa hybrid cultivar]
VSDNILKWSRHGFDLNTGPGIGDLEAKDEKLSSASRQLLVATSEVFMDEQARTYGFPGVKRQGKGANLFSLREYMELLEAKIVTSKRLHIPYHVEAGKAFFLSFWS